MIESIELNRNYAFFLTPILGGGKYNVQVIGTTDIYGVEKNEEGYNIFETFFQPAGVGLQTYTAAVNRNSKIYICLPIISVNPQEIGDKKLFIPEAIIDMNASQEYIKISKFVANISGMFKFLDDEDALIAYKQELLDKLNISMNEYIDFSVSDREVTISEESEWWYKEKIDELEANRLENYKRYTDRKQDILIKQKQKDYDYKNSLERFEEAREKYDNERALLRQTRIDLENKILEYERYMRERPQENEENGENNLDDENISSDD